MDADKILSANLLDILFEGKNKTYGAYELRNSYNKRISVALVITIVAIAILVISSTVANNFSSNEFSHMQGSGSKVLPPPQPPPPLPPPILPPPPVHVATIAFLTPRIVKDNLVIEPPPDVSQIAEAKIAAKTVVGAKDIGFIAPPSELNGSQVLAAPAEKKKEDSIFYKVEIDASFPGGADAWTKYVSRAIEGNIEEFTEPDFGTCIVRFIVDKAGRVSDVEATTMKNTKLAEIATNAIRKGPNWIPAQQNGTYVTAYRLQPVTLRNPNQ